MTISVLALLSLFIPSQSRQPAYREDERKDRGDAEREKRPDPEEHSARARDAAAHEACASHVREGHDRAEQRAEEDDDEARAAPGQHQRSVQPDDHHQYPGDVLEPARLESANDVVRQMTNSKEDRKQRRDG